jgi:glycosyltransferase involved in cell wall biosynthesis
MKKIVWVVGTLSEVGGGERLLLEGVKYYRSMGIDVHVITWKFNENALFDGVYENKNIISVDSDVSSIKRENILRRGINRLNSFFKFRKIVKQINPDLIICQNEYDCAFLYLSRVKIPYITLVFGQTFQFPYDIAKYTLTFKKHLNDIRVSTSGYKSTIPKRRPKTSIQNIWVSEVLCYLRYHAVRKSILISTFSKQVQWEVGLLYGRDTIIAKGAFSSSLLNYNANPDVINQIKSSPQQSTFLAVNRLVKKKRVDLIIKGFRLFLDKHRIDTKLIIGGTGPEQGSLKELCKDLDLLDYVSFIGYVPEKKILDLTASCNTFLSLDVADFDISPYTALALGKCVIWSNEMDDDDFLKNYPLLYPVDTTAGDVCEAMYKSLKNSYNTALNKFQNDSNLSSYSWEEYFGVILKNAKSKLRAING